jgi:glycosyltransferase involved in cell wall biosynthesis
MTRLDRTNTLVIVPAFNEQDSIVSVIDDIKATGFPFVVIDDGSTDETRNRAMSAGARTISLPFNAGVGGALKCGFTFAVKNGYQAVIQCDADGQHPTKCFERLVDYASATSSHLVVGTRVIGAPETMQVSKPRKAAMQCLALITNKRHKINVSDTTSGFRLISEPLLSQFAKIFPEYYLGDTFEALNVAASKGYLVRGVPVTLSNRAHGNSSSSTIGAMLNIGKSLTIQFLGIQFQIEPLITNKLNQSRFH